MSGEIKLPARGWQPPAAEPLPRPRKRLELVAEPAYIQARGAMLEFLYARHAVRAA